MYNGTKANCISELRMRKFVFHRLCSHLRSHRLLEDTVNVSVEEQVAIITASTRGFMDNVPVNKVKEFEKDYLELLKASHKPVLDNLRAGKFEDADVATMKKVAVDLASRYN